MDFFSIWISEKTHVEQAIDFLEQRLPFVIERCSHERPASCIHDNLYFADLPKHVKDHPTQTLVLLRFWVELLEVLRSSQRSSLFDFKVLLRLMLDYAFLYPDPNDRLRYCFEINQRYFNEYKNEYRKFNNLCDWRSSGNTWRDPIYDINQAILAHLLKLYDDFSS